MGHAFITGGIGSGKTYLAMRLHERTRLSLVSLDGVFFDLSSCNHREQRSPIERNRELAKQMVDGSRIFEGWHFGGWLIPLYRTLSVSVIVDTPLELRKNRIQTRFERRKAGMEPDPFPRGGSDHLENLLQWTALFNADVCEAAIREFAPADCVFMRTDGSDEGFEEIAATMQSR